jgi:uncharacterized protein YecE (DUF72 family)
VTAAVHVGTSGWHYRHWVGPFYPRDLRPEAFLRFYARHFRTAEINASFYRLPTAETVAEWRNTVGRGFTFAVKASRYATHMKKLKEPEQSLARFFDVMAGLKGTLGPVLFQLPPRFRANPERLAAFLAALPKGVRAAFEFRDRSWFTDPVLAALAAHGAALCVYDLAGWTSPAEVTAGFVYLRLHGPDGAYQGRYGRRRLRAWARRIEAWRDEGREVFCYFDNDQAGYAAADATLMCELVSA